MTIRAQRAEGNRVHIFCPGCSMVHGIRYGGENDWTWNGSLENPTFSPSLLVRMDYGNGLRKEDPNFKLTKHVCHSFITDGKIQFLGDSTHALANQTVDLPDWPYDD